MASTINGTSTGNGGLISTGDDSGILNIQTNETTAISIDASQKATLANDASISGLTVGKGGGAVAQNTVVGNGALAVNTTGRNTALGYTALALNTTGTSNTAVGDNALNAATTGSNNTAVGYISMANSTVTGSDNTAVGYGSLLNNTSGASNVAIGLRALNSNTTASNNTAVGYQAGYSTTTGAQITAVGYKAGYANTASGNCFIGYNAGTGNTSGSENTFVGGANNSGFGVGQANTTGTNNGAFGTAALAKNTTGSSNICLGFQAGFEITTGNNNVCLGYNTGNFGAALTTGGQNVYIGINSGPSSATVTYEMCIATLNSQGKGSTTGFINPNGGGVYQGNNSGAWSQVSDQRLKKNIVDNTDGLEKISQLRVRNFEYRLPEEVTELDPSCAIPNKGVQLGVIAQEIQEVFPDCVKTESTGVISVDSDNLTWYMVNAIKDLKAINDTQAETINALTARIVALETA